MNNKREKPVKERPVVRKLLLQLYGWLLFVACAVLFVAGSFLDDNPLFLAASLLFLLACLFFILPLLETLRRLRH
jgi:4-hydroxybenzoate polyprenyltransferase